MGKLELGKKGAGVKKLQRLLNDVGYSLPNNGIFDTHVREAVLDFQTQHHLSPDGVVDRQTKLLLKRSAKDFHAEEKVEAGVSPKAAFVFLKPHVDEPEFDDDFELEPIKPENQKATAFKASSISEARKHYDVLSGMAVDAAQKKAILADYRKKALLEVYGDAPSVQQIDAMREVVDRETWLQPEGMDTYFQYTLDSPNWFQGNLRLGAVFYNYTLKRHTDSKYRLEIKAVRNNKSNLVFASSVDIEAEDASKIKVKVFLSANKGYKWEEQKDSYLSAQIVKGDPKATFQAAGSMQNHHHGAVSPKNWEGKAFEMRTAIRTLVNGLITDFTTALA